MRSTGRSTSGAPEPDVVARARDGDHEAFRTLVERHQGRAYRLALRILRDPEQARDAVQEGFLKAYASLDRFDGRSGFYTWLYRLVFNLCIDMKRRDRSGRHVEWNDEVATREEASATARGAVIGDPEGDLARKETRDALRTAIAALPAESQRILLLREADGLSYAEIALTLEIPKGTVMSRLHHVRRRLRKLLTESGAAIDAAKPEKTSRVDDECIGKRND